MYPRLCKPLNSLSYFLLGPRAVGKTWLLRELFKNNANVANINLLEEKTYFELLKDGNRIKSFIKENSKDIEWIIIDEVQKIPSLLDKVHDILEDPKYFGKVFFILTGSSARKLKRGGANLLAGRALLYNLYPLSYFEVNEKWLLEDFLNWGSLPKIVTSESKELRLEILNAYVTTYLKEEIKEEQIVRQIEPFARFLEASAQANGTIVQYSNIASAAKVDEKAVARYFEILEDTLIGIFLLPYSASTRERTITKAKFFFFDSGVCRTIDRTIYSKLTTGTYAWGRAFEHFIILECIKLNSYKSTNARFSYLKTKDGAKIDLIIEKPNCNPLCIEIKSGSTIEEKEVNKLIKITESVPKGLPLLIYNGDKELVINGVKVIPWRKALSEIFEL